MVQEGQNSAEMKISSASEVYSLGIDPGKSGAWALLDGREMILAAGLWEERGRLMDTLKLIRFPIRACLEKVSPRPGEGVVSAFTFGANYGYWQGFLESSGICYSLITPQKWQKAVLDFVPAREPKQAGESQADNRKRLARNRSVLKDGITEFCRRRLPQSEPYLRLKKNQGIADAICMALYLKG